MSEEYNANTKKITEKLKIKSTLTLIMKFNGYMKYYKKYLITAALDKLEERTLIFHLSPKSTKKLMKKLTKKLTKKIKFKI